MKENKFKEEVCIIFDEQHLFIDFEFTMPERNGKYRGFFPEIIEVGFAAVHTNEIIEQYSSYVKPVRFPTLSGRCKSFLTISQEKVDSGITFVELVEKLKETVSQAKRTTVVTWGNMDMKVLRNNCHRNDCAFPFRGQEVDLSMEYKRFFGDQNQTGLWKAVQEYGKEGVGKHHRALDDALTTYHIFRLVEQDKRYLSKPEPTTIGERVDFSKLLNTIST